MTDPDAALALAEAIAPPRDRALALARLAADLSLDSDRRNALIRRAADILEGASDDRSYGPPSMRLLALLAHRAGFDDMPSLLARCWLAQTDLPESSSRAGSGVWCHDVHMLLLVTGIVDPAAARGIIGGDIWTLLPRDPYEEEQNPELGLLTLTDPAAVLRRDADELFDNAESIEDCLKHPAYELFHDLKELQSHCAGITYAE